MHITVDMEEQFKRKKEHVMNIYKVIKEQNTSTTDIIDSIKHSQYSKILFAIHANKPYDKLIWKLL